MSEMSNTDKLRAMLNERGAIHRDIGDMTFWHDGNCVQWCATEQSDGNLHVQDIDFMNPEQAIAATVARSCASCPEMDNPDSYISHLQSALRWHDEHVPRPTNPLASCVVLQGNKPPEEVLFVKDEGGVTHYKPEVTRCIDCAHYEHHIIAGLCHKLGRAMNPSDFCSRSERKADK